MQNALEVKELAKVIHDKIIVDRISFDVKEGETFGLLGSNGSGKTTTFNMLCGLLRPSSGKIKIHGKETGEKYDQRQDIGFVTQDDSLYTNLTVRQNLMYFASLLGVTNKEKKCEQILKQMGISERIDSIVGELSGGMRKRVNIACSLIHDPKIILLDEPSVGLDPLVRKDVWRVVEELNKAGKTVVITSHYMDEVEHLCSKVAIMYRGRIVAKGSPSELKTKYALKQMEDVFAHLIAEHAND